MLVIRGCVAGDPMLPLVQLGTTYRPVPVGFEAHVTRSPATPWSAYLSLRAYYSTP